MIVLILLLPLLAAAESSATQPRSFPPAGVFNERSKPNLPATTSAIAMTDSALNQKKTNPQRRVPLGAWGGQHIRMVVTVNGATIEYDCARGSIVGKLTLNANRQFNATGTHTIERPGPIRIGVPRTSRPARYEGKVTGDEMSLTVTLTDTSEDAGSFTLRRGIEGRLRKCL